MPVEIWEAVVSGDRDLCYRIRTQVFCNEQRVSPEIEFDGLDDACRHYLARRQSVAIGTARARPLESGVVKVERVAVLESWRRQGVGRMLMERLLADARRDGFVQAVLNSQRQAAPFYEELGFRQDGEEFLEANIPHVRMTRAS